MRRMALGLAILVLVAGGAVTTGYLSYHHATSGSPQGAPVSVTVPQGASLSSLEPQLAADGVIHSTLTFKLWLRLSGASPAGLQQGTYALRRDMGYQQVLDALAKGPQLAYEKLTIPEGFTVTQTAAKVGAATHIPADSFQAAATVATVQPSIIRPGVSSLEGFLYPQTYFVDPKATPAGLVQEMVAQFQTATAGVDWGAAPAGVTPYQVLTIASLIQNEAKASSDTPLVSSVIYNRLRAGMKLGIDATIYYGLGQPFTHALTRSDLATPSPYNTRLVAGLPPTPISSPGLADIQAALHPAVTNDLYYVLGSDCLHHQFFSSAAAFQQAADHQPTC